VPNRQSYYSFSHFFLAIDYRYYCGLLEWDINNWYKLQDKILLFGDFWCLARGYIYEKEGRMHLWASFPPHGTLVWGLTTVYMVLLQLLRRCQDEDICVLQHGPDL
jgi:hypothetical protein